MTPFAWSQPHDVNEHVAGIAKELRALGHTVTVLAPSGRTSDLVAGHRSLARGGDADVIAIGAAVPVSRRSSLGVPVGVRANVRLALQNGRFDVVHGFEPGLPSISYVALRDSEALGIATFFSRERLLFSAAPRAAREAACAARRAPRNVRGDGRGRGRAVSRRLPCRLARGRHGALPPGRKAEAGRDRAALRLAAGRANRVALAPRPPGLGGRVAADEAALVEAGNPPRAP